MSTFYFETTLAVTSQAPQIAIVNDAASGRVLVLQAVRIFGAALVGIAAERYDVEAALTPLQTAPDVHAFDDPDLVTAATVATLVSHTITEPSASSIDFAVTLYDATIGQLLPLPVGIEIRPGSSLLIETTTLFDGSGPAITFQVEYEELLDLPAAHMSLTLPASGAWTSAPYFAVPDGWSGLTFIVAYTAAASSTNAGPRWRVSASDGTNDVIAPIASSTLDVSASPDATRDFYRLVDKWPSSVAADDTVTFAVSAQRLPGMPQMRIDVAELGDTANPGSVVVTIVGE